MSTTKFLTLLLAVGSTQSARILGVFPMTSRSHYILGSSLMTALAEQGHDVTVISPFGEKNPPKQGFYRDIVLTGLVEEHDEKMKELMFQKVSTGQFLRLPFVSKMLIEMTEKTLNNTSVQKLIHSDETFDVVVVEEFFNQALKAFACHFKAHLVVLSTLGANSYINDIAGNPTPLSYISDAILGYSSSMEFSERLWNTIMYIWKQIVTHWYILPKQNKLIQKYFPNGPHLDEVLYNASLYLMNSHPSTNQPVPYVPQMIDIGGFHVKPPKKLPTDLQEYLDNANNGVIYFSLGSSVKSSILPLEKRQIFLDVFSKLKENILWKWEEDDLPGKPDNVRLGKWLPQQDILAHPNVKLFITHAGLLSTIETIYHGVQVLAVPLGADQNLNAQQIVNQGFGLALSIHDLTEHELAEKINQLLNNTKYRKNAKERTRFFHDRLTTPMETALYWIQYVIKHGGTSHLRVAGLDLPWYKYFLLDVMAVLITAVLAALYLNYVITKKILKSCCQQKKQKIKKQ